MSDGPLGLEPRAEQRRGRSGRRAEALIALAVLLLTGFVIQDWSAQPASRYLLTVAAGDDGVLSLDDYESFLGLDQARFDDHIYSDKAPYQPLLAVPAYLAYRSVGGDALPAGFPDGRFQEGTHYGLWWVTIWSSTIPAVGLALVVRRIVARTHPKVATQVALAIVLGTTILPFAGWLFGHVLAALCVAGAWALVRDEREERSPLRPFGAGCLLGIGIGTEYTVALIAVLVLVHVALSRSWRRVVALSAGTVVGTVPLLVYNWLVFDNPLETSYQGNLKNFEGAGALGVYNLQGPRLEEVGKALFGQRGLFVLTPIVAVAVVGAVLAIGQRTQVRRDAIIALAALVGMVVVSTGIDGLGGDSPGPRYLIPALPLLAVPLAAIWQRVPLVCAITAVFGAAWMWIASIADPGLSTTYSTPLRLWLERHVNGDIETNILTGDSHLWVLYVTGVLGIVAALAAVHSSRTRSGDGGLLSSEEQQPRDA